MASITGLSTQEAVDKIVTILRRVEIGVNQASEAWQVSTSSFISSTKVLNTRVNNLFHLMADETRSLDTLYRTMRNFYRNANNTLNHLSHSIIQISRIMLQLNEADTLYAAVQQTVTGSLSHLLVPPMDLNRPLIYLQNFLNERNANLELYTMEPLYYYRNVKFHTVRTPRRITVILHVPLTRNNLKQDLDVYEITKIPLMVPGSELHYNILAMNFHAFGYHPDADHFIIFSKGIRYSYDWISGSANYTPTFTFTKRTIMCYKSDIW